MKNQHDEPCCLELIRRAIVHRDLLAREAVQQHFNETVLHWLRSHPLNGAAICPADEETYVAQTFERFWQATTRSEQLEFSTPNAVLRHLRVILYGILLERQRAYSGLQQVTSPDSAGQGCGKSSRICSLKSASGDWPTCFFTATSSHGKLCVAARRSSVTYMKCTACAALSWRDCSAARRAAERSRNNRNIHVR